MAVSTKAVYWKKRDLNDPDALVKRSLAILASHHYVLNEIFLVLISYVLTELELGS